MSRQENSTNPTRNEGNSQRPLQNLDSAITPSSNHYPGALKGCSDCPDSLPRLPGIPIKCRDPNCPGCGPRLPSFPLVCEDPTCSQCNPLPVSVRRCPSCLEVMSPFGIGLGGEQQSTAERDRPLTNDSDLMIGDDRRKEEHRIPRERTTKTKSAAIITPKNSRGCLGLYPPSGPGHKRNQERRRTSTAIPAHLGATSDTERNFDRKGIKMGETRFGMVGRSMCTCGNPTCPGEIQAVPTQQPIDNTSLFKEKIATQRPPGDMLQPSFYLPTIGDMLGSAAMRPGLRFVPPAVPTVPMPPPGLTGPNNIWPGRMFASPTPMVMYDRESSAPGTNTMWPDGMFAARSGAVPKLREPDIGTQRDDEVMKRKANYAKLVYQTSFGRMDYLWKRLAQEQRTNAILKSGMGRMLKGDLITEQAMVKLGKKAFNKLDAWERLVLSKQKLEKARTELVACEIACEMAENERSFYERCFDINGKVGMKESKGKGKKLATDDVPQHSAGDDLADTSRDLLKKTNPPTVKIKEGQICTDCGGIKEDIQEGKSTRRESSSIF